MSKIISIILASIVSIPAWSACLPRDENTMNVAQALIWEESYSEALEELYTVSRFCRLDRNYKKIMAEANLGDCIGSISGLDFALQNGSSPFFGGLVNAFTGIHLPNAISCMAAESYIEQISFNPNLLTDEEQMLSGKIQLASITTMIKGHMDRDDDDKDLEPFDVCMDDDLPNDIADFIQLDIAQYLNLHNLYRDNTLGGIFDMFQVMCTHVHEAFDDSAEKFCDVENYLDITADHRRIMRSILNEGLDYGLGNNCEGNLHFCQCL